jgi:hypothetical protein
MRGPQLATTGALDLGEGAQRVPGLGKPLHHVRSPLAVALLDLGPPLRARRLPLGLWHGTQQRARVRLLWLQEHIQPIRDAVVAAAWLRRRRLRLD